MLVEVLTFEGCPHAGPAIDLAQRIVDESAVPAHVRVVDVRAADAERLRFVGSPSVRVDGRDVEPGADTRRAYGHSCRRYMTHDGIGPLPDAALVASCARCGRPDARTNNDMTVPGRWIATRTSHSWHS
jgi:hypothetical protein